MPDIELKSDDSLWLAELRSLIHTNNWNDIDQLLYVFTVFPIDATWSIRADVNTVTDGLQLLK